MNQLYTVWVPAIVAALLMASFSMPVSLLTLLTHNILGHEQHRSKLTSYSLLYLCGAVLALGLLIFLALSLASLPVFQNDQRYHWSLYSLLIIDGLFVLLFYYRGDRGTRLWLPRKTAVNLTKSVEEVGNGADVFLSGGLSIFAELLLTIVPIFVAAVALNKLSYPDSLYAGIGFIFVALLPVIILILANAAGQKISKFQRFREKNKAFFQVVSGALMIILGVYLLIVK
jgi:cytochrome c biogenesis protein CcdA